MTGSECQLILRRLTALFMHEPDETTIDEYVNALESLDFNLINKTVDKVALEGINGNTKFFPKLPELYSVYREVERTERQNRVYEKQTKFCYVCENNGFVAYEEEGIAQVLYCTECEKGEAFKYDGSKCKDHKSPYIIHPVTLKFDVKELEAKNSFKNREVKPAPDNVKQLMKKIGYRMAG